MPHTHRKWPRSNIPILGMIKRYIDDRDEHPNDQPGPPGPRGPKGDPGPQGPPGTLRPRGPDVPLTVVAPATSTGLFLTPNPDGSATLSGTVTIAGPFSAGEPVVFTHLPAGQGPDRPVSFPCVAWHTTDRAYVPIRIDLNESSGSPSDVFLMPPDIADGVMLTFTVDSVTIWLPDP